MSRLTNQLREKMLETVLDHAFLSKINSAQKAKIVAGEKIYQDIYGPYLIAMESLPKGFLPRTPSVYIAVAGQKHCVDFSEPRLIGKGHGDRYSQAAKLYVGDEQVAADFLKTVSDLTDIENDRSNMKREVRAVLESVHTFKKLWEVWPECKSILEKFEVKPSIAILPAVQVDRLNSVLGLPAKEDGENEKSSN